MPGPYSEHNPERAAVRLVVQGFLEIREDGSIWRVKSQNGRPQVPRRVDYHRGDILEGHNINHLDGDPSNNRTCLTPKRLAGRRRSPKSDPLERLGLV